jgi:hypothetical protein
MEFEFTLTLTLSADESGVDDFVERLGDAGCTDALVGTGQVGRIALHFNREADSVRQAMHSALQDIARAI